MLQTSRVTTFTVFELLRENQLRGGNQLGYPPPPSRLGLRYLRFQVLSTCNCVGAKNTCRRIENWKKKKLFFFFYRYQHIIEPKMAFGSLLGCFKWCHKFWLFLNTINLLLNDCIVYSQKISSRNVLLVHI